MRRKNLILALLPLIFTHPSAAQRLNVGFTFQYHILKQVKIEADMIEGAHSFSQYEIRDNGWKFFSAGQSIVIGTVLQMNYKQFYAVVEPSFDLNTYNYYVYYPLSPGRDERLNFRTLFMQADLPLYAGFQFGATNLIRYSLFAGAVLVLPYRLEYAIQSRDETDPPEEYFNSADMDNIIYGRSKYLNALAGFCLHFASLGKADIRYQYRLGSPGEVYPVVFHTVGFGLTYYLPMNLRKKKIYYDE